MILKIIVLISYIYMLTMNYLANAIPFGGNTTGDISGKYPTLFTPSGFTFSIWGLIYTLVSLFILLLFLNDTLILQDGYKKILILFTILNFLNGSWLFFWHNDYQVLSTIIIISMLVCLLIILPSLDKNYLITYLTFSIYAGWISIATIANISIVLYKSNIGLFMNNQSIWFYIILLVGIIIASATYIKTKNIPYVSVYIWAYFGILMKYIN